MQLRLLFGVALAVVSAVWLACDVELPPSEFRTPIVATKWRHTTSGWEKYSDLTMRQSGSANQHGVWATHPHPAVITLLTVMLSVTALLAFNPADLSKSSVSPASGPSVGNSEN
jgi:hypothetical protein